MERLVEDARDDVMARLWNDFNFTPRAFANQFRILGRAPYLIRIAEALREHPGTSHIADIDCAAVHYGYRAAMRASKVVLPDAAPATELFKQATDGVLNRTVLTESADTYLKTRPVLEGVLVELALSIAPDDRAIQDMRTAGGFGFLLVDLNEEHNHIDSEFAAVIQVSDITPLNNLDAYYQ